MKVKKERERSGICKERERKRALDRKKDKKREATIEWASGGCSCESENCMMFKTSWLSPECA
jgi:hypothetical protein